MRFSLQLPVDRADPGREFHTPHGIAEMAAAIERAGFDACWVTDHPAPTAEWLSTGGHQTLDPFVALSFAAAATTTLRLHTNAYIPAYRSPFVSAKAAATLDVLSGGRLILGVAAGYLEGEFDALGVPFKGRGRLLDDAIRLMKLAWQGEEIREDGAGWTASGNVVLPAPVSKPHPPIWIGGNSRAAMRRAVALGDGWMPFPAPRRLAAAVGTEAIGGMDDLRRKLRDLAELSAAERRDRPLDINFQSFTHPHGKDRFDPRRFAEEVAELAEIGVTWMSVHLPAPSRAAFLDNVARFGDQALAVANGKKQ
ncbi:MAG: hypothetical protein QOE54_3330 [Streptosporangiaceae bacterium]|nr:luciferase family protein [Streptosporangiaceae bacterium]MDX6430964.1 hypothetical protein [Streptosporangiaceae bacterium]